MAKIKIKHLASWWTRGLKTPPSSGKATNHIVLTPQAYYEKSKEYYMALYELRKDNDYYTNNPYYKVFPNEDAKQLYFRRADGRCGNMKIAKTAADFYDFWHNSQSEKWQSDGFNNNTHPTELSPDYLAPKYKEGLNGHFVLYGGVNRHDELYKIWLMINHDGTVELRNYDHIMREFDEEEYIEVISRSGYYYHRFYPNKLYVNGRAKYRLSAEEFQYVKKSKTTIQLKREEARRWEMQWEKERRARNESAGEHDKTNNKKDD